MYKRIRKLSQLVKDHGLLNLLLYKLDIVAREFSKNKIKIVKYYFFAQPIVDTIVVKHAHKRKIKIRLLNYYDPILDQCPRPLGVINERFAQQSKCFVASKDNEFIGFIWLSQKAYMEDEVRSEFIPMPINESVWDYDVYIKPESRLSLAFPMLWDQVNTYLSERGYRWTMSRISGVNSASLSTHKKLGAQECGQSIFVCFWRLQLMFSSIPPYIHMSITGYPSLGLFPPKK